MQPKSSHKLGLKPMVTGVWILVIAGLGAVLFPVVLEQRRKDARMRVLSNLKDLSTMLSEFDSEYGGYPDDKTALEVRKATGTDWVLTGQFSNDYFRQLMAGKSQVREEVFWCQTPQSPKKPDEDFSTPAKALAAGEVGWSYIMASQTQGRSASGEPSRPVIVTPSYKFQDDWTFDPSPFGGKVIVLRMDNSATPLQVRESDRKVATDANGKALGEVGEGTVWGTDVKPVLKAPQPR